MHSLITAISPMNIQETPATAELQEPSLQDCAETVCYHEEPKRIKAEKLIKKFHLKLITEIIQFT